jgi:CBS domain-containing protein
MTSVKDLLSENVVTINVRKTALDAALLMSERKIGCLVVNDGEVPVGIVTERDLIRRVLAKKLPLDVKISDIMSKPLITINPDSSLRDTARLMIKNKVRRLPVVKDDKLVGIIVVSDFARQLSKKSITEEILEAMARYPYASPLSG